MVSEELADEDISAEEYEEAKKEICREYGTDDDQSSLSLINLQHVPFFS
mgnify:CR=1 FL=1